MTPEEKLVFRSDPLMKLEEELRKRPDFFFFFFEKKNSFLKMREILTSFFYPHDENKNF